MKKGIKTSIISFVLSCVLACSLFSTTLFAQNSISTDEINGYSKDTGYDYVYLGTKDNQPFKWRVLSDNGNAVGKKDYLLDDSGDVITNDMAFFIMADEILDVMGSPNTWDNYQNSEFKEWCTGIIQDNSQTSLFSETEKKILLNTTKDDEEITIGNLEMLGVSEELKNDKLFLLSISEVTNEKYGFINSTDACETRSGQYNGEEIPWIQRQPFLNDFGRLFSGAYIVEEGIILNSMYMDPTGLRPAANVNKKSILFSSAAENGKGDFDIITSNTTHEWKLTLKDDNTFTDGTSISTTTCAPGKDITITHKKLSEISADYTNVTAAISDKDGNLLYYGSLSTDVNATETKLTVPADFQDGIYKLAVYGEDWNGDKFTDYATGTPFETELTVDSKAGDDTPAPTPTPAPAAKAGTVVTVGNLNYKITSVKANSCTVTVTGMKNKKKTSVKIPATVRSKNVSYKVTAVANNAFKGNKKLKSVTIGKNVTSIGKNVFKGCKNLKKITLSTKVLKKVGAGCLKGIHKKAVIKVPAKNKKAYKKLFKKKGQAKTVKIK